MNYDYCDLEAVEGFADLREEPQEPPLYSCIEGYSTYREPPDAPGSPWTPITEPDLIPAKGSPLTKVQLADLFNRFPELLDLPF